MADRLGFLVLTDFHLKLLCKYPREIFAQFG